MRRLANTLRESSKMAIPVSKTMRIFYAADGKDHTLIGTFNGMLLGQQTFIKIPDVDGFRPPSKLLT
jgi:hypothetical protein